MSSLGKSLKDYSSDNNIDNAKKVAEIKSKVDSGTYSIDARITARSILNAMKGE
ncbi:flagellar biosynthesis anti-sigma factor FlgM [Clostridium butyricum]